MKVSISELPDSEKGLNPLLVAPGYAPIPVSRGVSIQIISKLDENPAKLLVHDRLTGHRRLITLDAARDKIEKMVLDLHVGHSTVAANADGKVSKVTPITSKIGLPPPPPFSKK